MACLVPAAAVITSRISYIKAFEVENLIVGILVGAIGPTLRVGTHIISLHRWG